MQSVHDSNLTPTDAQEADRICELRVWMVRNEVSFVDMGKNMGGVTGNAALKALKKARMPVDNHKLLRDAYPHLPLALLPQPLDVPPGPKPRATPGTPMRPSMTL